MNIRLRNKHIEKNYAEELLKWRGVVNIDSFLNPTIEMLQSPLYLDNIEQGGDLISKINRDDKILIVVDCDVDGYCSSAIIYNWLKENIKEHSTIDFITHYGKQHGLEDIVERVCLDNYTIVIIPDASTNDDKYFQDYPNVKFLILDHHDRTESIENVPSNAIIINNQISKEYKNKSLCGAGVTWQFCRYLDATLTHNEYFSDGMIDLVAVATIADMMDITVLENRYIIEAGLKSINNLFLKTLIDKQAFSLGSGPLTPTGVAFYIAPLINAMCRSGAPQERDRMFLAFADGELLVPSNKRGAAGTSEKVAIESARECTNAKSRQTKAQEKMTERATIQILNNNLLANKILTIVLDESFDDIPNEINGLSATKISNHYGLPTLVGRVNKDGEYKGSIRGLPTIDMPPLKEFLLSSGFFTFCEGHDNAAGFGMKISKLDKFHEWANEKLSHVGLEGSLWEVDFIRHGSNFDIQDIIHDLNNINHTWGQGNPEALIYVEEINIDKKDISIMGSKKDTVKILHKGIGYMFFKCKQEDIERLTEYEQPCLNIVGTMNINHFNGASSPQVFVKDFEVTNGKFSF